MPLQSISLLAKLDPSQASVVAQAPSDHQSAGTSVSLVVQEGVQVCVGGS